ncbi:MAG: DoxX family protein [Phycisphaerales bacterium]
MNTALLISFETARAASAAAFLGYGIACLLSERMDVEFRRYGLARFRRLVGTLECLGALGLLAGHFSRPVLVLAAAGLTLLMLLAVVTRIRIGDSFAQALPAIVLLLLNAFVLVVAVTRS